MIFTEDNPLNIYIGYDSREHVAYEVAKASIEETTSIPVNIIPLKQKKLRSDKIYTRQEDALASTEFTFTRFLVPYLNDYKGWAIFVDCDFLFLTDIAEIVEDINNNADKAILCAHHDYRPTNDIKMDGQVQTRYPRKNWSSFMVINCAHDMNKTGLTLETVNNPALSGAHFHRFNWLRDDDIGEISHEWNWLVDWYHEPKDGSPKALHYTEGGPWFEEYKNCSYASEWLNCLLRIERADANKKKN